MPDTHTLLYYHVVWSTQQRLPLIAPSLQTRLHEYLGGIAREGGFEAVRVGGVEDHVHALLRLPPTMTLSKAVQLLKTNSSRWIQKQTDSERAFAWQTGYAAFSVSYSSISDVITYIERQREHHERRSFREEFDLILARHGMQVGDDGRIGTG